MTGRHPLLRFAATIGFLLAALPALAASDLRANFEAKTTTFTLDNGLSFVVVERHQAPVVSFATYADVGSVDEPLELAGLAHMFEHMAFKGTTSIGSKNIAAEIPAMREQEQAYLALRRAKLQANPDAEQVKKLQKAFDDATKTAQEYANSAEFDEILQRAGVVGLNATTSADRTLYFYSLPSNRVELFFALESDRFIHPVMREFYTERGVVMEERRMRTESRPIGRLIEAFTTTAFKASHYGIPVIGYDSTILNYSRSEAKELFRKYYVPSNVTIAVVGDVDASHVKELAEQYFSDWKATSEPPPIRVTEPEQLGERRVTIREATQPFLAIGYHRPGMYSKDDAVYDVLADVLGVGRTSRFHEQLVETKKALVAQAIAAYPGNKFSSLFTIFALPNQGGTTAELEQDIYKVLAEIKTKGISKEELQRAKTRARADLIGSLDSNTAIATMFARAEMLQGDWRAVFENLAKLEAVTVDDVKRVANETFKFSNRTVGSIVHEAAAEPAKSGKETKAGGSAQ